MAVSEYYIPLDTSNLKPEQLEEYNHRKEIMGLFLKYGRDPHFSLRELVEMKKKSVNQLTNKSGGPKE